MNYRNGNRYEGDFTQGRLNGKGNYSYRNGNSYTGDFVNDQFHGRGIYIYNSGNQYIGDFLKAASMEVELLHSTMEVPTQDSL